MRKAQHLNRLQAEIQELKARKPLAAPVATAPGQDTRRLLQPGSGAVSNTPSLDEDLLDRFVREHASKVLPEKVAGALSLIPRCD